MGILGFCCGNIRTGDDQRMAETIGYGGLGEEGFVIVVGFLAAAALTLILWMRRDFSKSSKTDRRKSAPLIIGCIMIAVSIIYVLVFPNTGTVVSIFIDRGEYMTKDNPGMWDPVQRQFIKDYLKEFVFDLQAGEMGSQGLVLVCAMAASSLIASLAALMLNCPESKEQSIGNKVVLRVGTTALAGTVLMNAGKWLALAGAWVVQWLMKQSILLSLVLSSILIFGLLAYLLSQCASIACAYTIMMIVGMNSLIVFAILYVILEFFFMIADDSAGEGTDVFFARIKLCGICFGIGLVFSLFSGFFR